MIKLDKREKELEDSQGKRLLFTLGIIVSAMLVVVVVASALSSAPAKEPEEQAVLDIDDVFFLYSGSKSELEKVTIDVTTFITNKGTADAKDVQIIAFAIDDDSNLAMDKTTFTVGDILKENTKPTEFSITVPNNDSYNIRLIILENGKLAIKGTGTVHLDKNFGGRGTRFTPDYESDGDDDHGFAKEDEHFFVVSSSFILLFLICIIMVTVIVLKRSYWARKLNMANYPSNEYNKLEIDQGDSPRFPQTNIEGIISKGQQEPRSGLEEYKQEVDEPRSIEFEEE